MSIRKLVILLALVIATPAARADVALGAFLGEPTGLDVKLGLAPRSALDIVLGWDTYHDYRTGYGHLTYLVTPVVASGSSVLVPLRLGIGAVVMGPSNDVRVGVRLPLEVGLRFRSAPLELYGEIALKFVFVNEPNGDYLDVDGGFGIRFYF